MLLIICNFIVTAVILVFKVANSKNKCNFLKELERRYGIWKFRKIGV